MKKARLKISIVSDRGSWLNAYLNDLVAAWKRDGHAVRWIHDAARLPAGDLAFALSCGQILSPMILKRNRHTLVVHESALPKGKGWSPLTWQILEGRRSVPITLFEAAERVDSGVIYLEDRMEFEGHELIDELRNVQAEKTIALCRRFVRGFPAVVKRARTQRGTASFYARRTAADSRLDPRKTLAAQFDLLRTVDNDRYPAFLDFRGHRYVLSIRKAERLKETR